MANMKFFKGGKSKAIIGLRRQDARLVDAADRLLFAGTEKGEFGFDLDAAAALIAQWDALEVLEAEQEAPGELTTVAPEAEVEEVEVEVEVPLTKAQQAAQDDEFDAAVADTKQVAPKVPEVLVAEVEEVEEVATDLEDESGSDNESVVSSNMFSQLLNTPAPQEQSATSPRSRRQAETTYSIEKNRPRQNGINRPSIGGTCREIWNALDVMVTDLGRNPTTKEMKTLGDNGRFSMVTLSIQMYQWRKFNGIFGRVAKETRAAKEATALPLPTCDELPTIDFPEGFEVSVVTPPAAPQESDLPVLDL